MSLQVELCFINGETKELTISPNEGRKSRRCHLEELWKSVKR